MKYNEIGRGCLGKSTLMSAPGDVPAVRSKLQRAKPSPAHGKSSSASRRPLPQERLDLWGCCMATLSDDKLQMTVVIWEVQKDTRTRHSSFKLANLIRSFMFLAKLLKSLNVFLIISTNFNIFQCLLYLAFTLDKLLIQKL